MSNIQEILNGLKSLKDAGTVSGMIKNSALEQAIRHYEKLQQESKTDRVQVVLSIIVTEGILTILWLLH